VRRNEDDIAENRQEIESLLSVLERSAPAMRETRDSAITDARLLASAIRELDERGASRGIG